MENSKAILIELSNFLFPSWEEFSALQVGQSIDTEAKDLLLEMQEYSNLIGFCKLNPRASKFMRKRLDFEGLNFKELFLVDGETYDKIKILAFEKLKSKYSITCYIDETEDSPWHNVLNLHRLKY